MSAPTATYLPITLEEFENFCDRVHLVDVVVIKEDDCHQENGGSGRRTTFEPDWVSTADMHSAINMQVPQHNA